MFSMAEIADGGKETYAILESALKRDHPGKYAAIDPISKEYFIGATIGEAVMAGHAKYPFREFYTVRIGVQAAISFKR